MDIARRAADTGIVIDCLAHFGPVWKWGATQSRGKWEEEDRL